MAWLALILLLVLFLGAAALVPDRLPRGLRLAAIVASPTAAVLLWFAVHAYEGWPLAVDKPPIGAVFVAGVIHEPDSIYLWLTPRGSQRPRAYHLPYSDQLYAQILRAQQATKRGETITVQNKKKKRRGAPSGILKFQLRRYKNPPLYMPSKTSTNG